MLADEPSAASSSLATLPANCDGDDDDGDDGDDDDGDDNDGDDGDGDNFLHLQLPDDAVPIDHRPL